MIKINKNKNKKPCLNTITYYLLEILFFSLTSL